MPEESPQIGFRFRQTVPEDREAAQRFEESRGQESPGEFARRLVIDGLQGGGQAARMESELAEVKEELQRLRATAARQEAVCEEKFAGVMRALGLLRGDIGTAAMAILVDAGMLSPQEAKLWAIENLFGRHGPDAGA